jgi:trigger factor
LSLIEKQVDQNALQTEFLDLVVNRVYVDAITADRLRPIDSPTIAITKFVPFSELEMTAEVEVVGTVKLPDYKKIKLEKPAVKVTAKDVDSVLENLRERLADKNEVTRAAKDGDELTIDFAGVDAKTKEAIAGTDGKDYPLILGSDSFIPGFEEALVGLKAGDTKQFDVVFPKDYGVATLQNRKVTFDVTVKKVTELAKPSLDDDFAGRIGSFKTLADLKADIKQQVTAERQQEVDRNYESELLETIAKKTKAEIPEALITEEVDRQLGQVRQNLMYRGQTWEEYLSSEGVTEAELREQQRPAAALRVTAGLALSDIAEAENIFVTPEEVDVRLQLIRGQYQDEAMRAELEKPETRRELGSRILSEKTIARLTDYATK